MWHDLRHEADFQRLLPGRQQALRPKTRACVGVVEATKACGNFGQCNEFIRVGYYVNNEYEDIELQNNPPNPPILNRIVRNILAEKPRVTRFPIQWDQMMTTEESVNNFEL